MLRLVVWAAALVLVAPVVMDPAVARAATAEASVEDAGDSADSSPEVDDPTETPAPTPSPSGRTEEEQPSPATPTNEPTPAPEPTEKADDDAVDDAAAEPKIMAATGAAVPVPGASRISIGSDPYAAAVTASKALFPNGTANVILVPGTVPVFGAFAASLAAETSAAVLYVQPGAIPAAVLTELRRLSPTKITVVAGSVYVSEAVLTSARSVAPDVRRIGGANPYETARLLFQASTAPGDTVYLAGAKTIDDIPLAHVLGSVENRRILVANTHGAALDSATVAALRQAGTRSVVIVASTSPVPYAYASALTAAGFHVTRITRTEQYSLSATVSAQIGAGRAASLLVNPSRPIDTSVAAVYAALTRQPLYYSMSDCVPDGIVTHIANAAARTVIIGDTAGVPTTVACSVVKSQREARLTEAIRSAMSNYKGTYSVTVREIGGLGEIAQVSGGTRREPASMMKIFAAWAAYTRIDQGRASWNTVLPSGVQLGVCLYVMIHVSDNYCHSDIVHWIGIAEVNRMIRAAGFSSTSYGTVPRGVSVLYAGNRTTTNDLAYMADRLQRGTALSKASSTALLNIMRWQIGRSRIASGIPVGVPQASKPGALWVASGLLQGDTAIVTGPRKTYALSIIGDDGPPKEAFRAISRVVYTHFNGSFGTAASYPVQQMVTKTPSLLRASPGGAVVGTIPSGVVLEQLESQRTWYQVQYGSRKLWVWYTGLRNR